jgi:hypothetical protein
MFVISLLNSFFLNCAARENENEGGEVTVRSPKCGSNRYFRFSDSNDECTIDRSCARCIDISIRPYSLTCLGRDHARLFPNESDISLERVLREASTRSIASEFTLVNVINDSIVRGDTRGARARVPRLSQLPSLSYLRLFPPFAMRGAETWLSSWTARHIPLLRS